MTARLVFAGSVELNPERTLFQYVGECSSMPAQINLEQYLLLSLPDRDEYAIESISDAITFCDSSDFDQLEIEEDGDD
jgi:hypothetical protein